MRQNIVRIFILLLVSLTFLGTTTNKRVTAQNIVYHDIDNEVVLSKPNQDMIQQTLDHVNSTAFRVGLKGYCNTKEYTYATLDTQRLRILKLYTKLAIKKLNEKCAEYATSIGYVPFVFSFNEFINATSSINNKGNSRWNVDIMVQELSLRFSLRMNLDFVVEVEPCKGKEPLTCAAYTTFPFPRYFGGYPTLDQMIPLPSQVIVTGMDVLGQAGKDPNYPNFKGLYLNSVKLENSDLALGTALGTTDVVPAVNDTKLGTSKYPSKRFTRKKVSFPEKYYADCLEATGKAVDTDIVNKFKLKPVNYNCTGKSENDFHSEGGTESYAYSVASPDYPPGWIEPASIRNKWPRLWSQPRDRYEWPSTPVSHEWDLTGIRKQVTDSGKNPGIRWSVEQPPRVANYWPTITGIPTHGGPNYWLFDKTRGFTANLPHGGR